MTKHDTLGKFLMQDSVSRKSIYHYYVEYSGAVPIFPPKSLTILIVW